MNTRTGGEQSPFEARLSAEEIQKESKELVFDSFSRQDALDLGMIAVQKAKELQMAFSIRIEYNGIVVFQYLPAGTNQFNIDWMEKKIECCKTFRTSTMALWVRSESMGIKRKNDEPIPTNAFVLAGGGFPFLLKDGEVVGALAVSGPGDQNDHYFGLECLEELIAQKNQD